ncbi:uncharacterized protein SAMN02982929_05209 [Saccharopolyspora kobensis]|uniref:DUF418 domain-containing protein n=1 Tax=Saccharopolyspora kobensis TaxID=146035 RepID=A0A1H6DYD3_9PSEU|nr:DUF418 domain-containing protein [Saccharopolyspora kobensis]SEG90338.1 uncharacterized protein SAMN02982929_05209 [Saccharopolyspora kobensis]SFD90690.1 uncharacterized protein SAMN05216506_107183 [Saccharopolyspora kobensis]
MTTLQQVPTSTRIGALDVIRGVAILGTLGTNIWIFTNPQGPTAALNITLDGGASYVEAALRWLANGKFLALLTLLFGIGLELQYRSAKRRGGKWPGWYLWRAGLLFTEGLLHYVLIFEYDVLMSYAVTSILVAYLIGRSDRAQRGWMIAMGTVHVAFIGLTTLGMLSGHVSLSTPPTDLYTHGSYLEQLTGRLTEWGSYRAEAIFIIPLSTLLFLAGARLYRAGVFNADQQRLRNRLMLFGFGIGVPLNLVTTFAGPEWLMVDRYILPPAIALGLLGLIPTVLASLRGEPGVLRRGLTSVGRTALSCYVFQNLVGAVLCYGWGLGLAAQFDWARPWWVLLAWAAICATFMTLASLWLRRFERGPLEAVWNWAYHLPQRSAR